MTQTIPSVRVLLIAIQILCLPLLVAGQVTIYATNHTVLPDEEFTVEIKVQDFDSIVGCQFSMMWDTTLFKLKGAGQLNAALESLVDNFNYSEADSGFIGFLWFDPSVQPVSLEDDATLFTMDFEVIEEASTVDSIKYSTFPVATEFANANEETLDVNFNSGVITIDGISDVLNRNGKETLAIQIAPNPFEKQTQVTLDFKRAVNRGSLKIYSAQGNVILQREQDFATGTHQLQLDRNTFGQSGTYFLEIKATDFIVTHKLIVL